MGPAFRMYSHDLTSRSAACIQCRDLPLRGAPPEYLPFHGFRRTTTVTKPWRTANSRLVSPRIAKTPDALCEAIVIPALIHRGNSDSGEKHERISANCIGRRTRRVYLRG